MSRESRLEELEKRRRWAEELGGAERVEREHALGRLTIRERIERVVDPGTFQEVGKLTGRGDYDGAEVKHVAPAPYVAGIAEI
ncbi:MAG: methylmalonyl-CoA carboxyltransferase, partial [Alphaproteobacteria bacterium]|nr:methylmalonyl-CoA carboxyltransferase [Alphaproteobacteria bacterium]